jgi:hypothetical protein
MGNDVKIELADTAIRAYKMGDGAISLRLRSYLLVHAGGFNLTAKLKDIKSWIKLPGKNEVEFKSVTVGDAAIYADNFVMLHDLWAATVIPGLLLRSCVANFRMKYHISFTGHATEKPKWIHKKVPVLVRF